MSLADKVIKHYGWPLSITAGGSTSAAVGFISPLSFGRDELPDKAHIAGRTEQTEYLLIVPSDAMSEDGQKKTVISLGSEYEVRRQELIMSGGEPSHYECLLRFRGRVQSA